MDKDKKQHTEFHLIVDKEYNFKLSEGQHPRGIRYKNKRPDVVVIDCYKSATKQELQDFIDNLIILYKAMV